MGYAGIHACHTYLTETVRRQDKLAIAETIAAGDDRILDLDEKVALARRMGMYHDKPYDATTGYSVYSNPSEASIDRAIESFQREGHAIPNVN